MHKTKNKSFTDAVKEVVKSIPKGETMTYGQVAKKAGSPLGARAVARIMSANYSPEIPCHRVVRADGTLGGYNRGGIKKKAIILTQERLEA